MGVFYLSSISKKTIDNSYNIITINGIIEKRTINITFNYHFNNDNVDTIIDELKKELNISSFHNFTTFRKYLILFSKINRFHSISNL
jgi:ACT domain-containing protein